jgi:hypothetical protein
MCSAIANGALISTYGPDGTMRGGTPIDKPGPYSLQSATCKPQTPWAWCWGAPCYKNTSSATGITCDCPYMVSTPSDVNQPISLAGEDQCSSENPCEQLHNSMPAGTSPNHQTACYNETGIVVPKD